MPEVTQLSSGRQDLNQDLVASRLWGSRRRLQGLEPGPTALGRDQPLPLVVTRSGRCPQPLPWTRHVAVSSSCPSTPASPANVFIRGDRGTGEVLAPLGRTAHAGHGSLAGLREPGLSPRARAACAFYRSLPCEHLLTLPGGPGPRLGHLLPQVLCAQGLQNLDESLPFGVLEEHREPRKLILAPSHPFSLPSGA